MAAELVAFVNLVGRSGCAACEAADQRALPTADQRSDSGASRAGTADDQRRLFPRAMRSARHYCPSPADADDAFAALAVEPDRANDGTSIGTAVHGRGSTSHDHLREGAH